MQPHLGRNDKQLFYKYLDRSRVYFEYGAGGSTYQAAIRDNIKKIYSVESDGEWHRKLQDNIPNKNHIKFLYNEMKTLPNTWGYPGPGSTHTQWINYSNQLPNLNLLEKNEIDLVMIDGRFRVACCLKCFNSVNDDCAIIFDDFLNRKQYHKVLNYYDIIEKTSDNQMVVLKKKSNIENIPNDVIKKYELEKRC